MFLGFHDFHADRVFGRSIAYPIIEHSCCNFQSLIDTIRFNDECDSFVLLVSLQKRLEHIVCLQMPYCHLVKISMDEN